MMITKDIIAQRAYALYLARGSEDGHDVEDWLQAERELQDEGIRFQTRLSLADPVPRPTG